MAWKSAYEPVISSLNKPIVIFFNSFIGVALHRRGNQRDSLNFAYSLKFCLKSSPKSEQSVICTGKRHFKSRDLGLKLGRKYIGVKNLKISMEI